MRCPATIDWVQQETQEEGGTLCELAGHDMRMVGPIDDDEEGRIFARYRCSRCGETTTEAIPEEGAS